MKFYLDFHRITRPWRRTLTNGSDVKGMLGSPGCGTALFEHQVRVTAAGATAHTALVYLAAIKTQRQLRQKVTMNDAGTHDESGPADSTLQSLDAREEIARRSERRRRGEGRGTESRVRKEFSFPFFFPKALPPSSLSAASPFRTVLRSLTFLLQ